MEADFLWLEFSSNMLAPWLPRNSLTWSSVVCCRFRSPGEAHMKNEQLTLLERGDTLRPMVSTAYTHGFLRSSLDIKLRVFHVSTLFL